MTKGFALARIRRQLVVAALIAVAMDGGAAVLARQSAGRAARTERTRVGRSDAAATRTQFLQRFARAYFPGRTGQILVVPREGDIITRQEPDLLYMHGSP